MAELFRLVNYYLVGGLEHVFFHILGIIIIPIGKLRFFRGAGLNHQPVTIDPECMEPPPVYRDDPFKASEKFGPFHHETFPGASVTLLDNVAGKRRRGGIPKLWPIMWV